MAFKTFVGGEVLTAADVNDYLMEQAVIVCTSATRPGSPAEGMTIYETDTDVANIYSGSGWLPIAAITGWVDYSSSLGWTGSGSNPAIGNGTKSARYRQIGKTIVYNGCITMGSTTTYGTGYWLLTLPVNWGGTGGAFGGAAGVFDNSATNNNRPGICFNLSSTQFRIDSTTGNVDATNPITWATSDKLYWMITYEAA